MNVLDVIFWVFFGGVVVWILGVWISMLIPWRPSSARRTAASSGGGFAETGIDSMMSHSSDVAADAGGGESAGGESGGGEFSGGGGESGGGGSSGGW